MLGTPATNFDGYYHRMVRITIIEQLALTEPLLCAQLPCEAVSAISLYDRVGARPSEIKWLAPGLPVGQRGSQVSRGLETLPWLIFFRKE